MHHRRPNGAWFSEADEYAMHSIKKVGRLRDRPKWLFWPLSLINVIAKWPENLPKRRDLGAFHSGKHGFRVCRALQPRGWTYSNVLVATVFAAVWHAEVVA